MRFWSAGALMRAASMAKKGAAGVISPPPSAAWPYHAGMKGHVSIGSGRPGLKSIGLSNRIEYPWAWSGPSSVSTSKRKLKKVFAYVTQNRKEVLLRPHNLFSSALVFNVLKFWMSDLPNKAKQEVNSAATVTRLINLEDQLTEVKAMNTKSVAKLEEKFGWVLAGQGITVAVISFIAWFTTKP